MKNLFKLGYLGIILSILSFRCSDGEVFNCRRLRSPINLDEITASCPIEAIVLDADIDFVEIFKDIIDGKRSSYNRTINNGDVRIEMRGQHLAPASERGELSLETGFLTIRVFNHQNDILAYSVIYPTYHGYALAYSQRANEDIGVLAESLMAKAKHAFGLEPGTYYAQELRIQPRSAQILGSYLAPYFYEKNISSGVSSLEAFILTVDNIREEIASFSLGDMPDAETIERRIDAAYNISSVLTKRDFSNYPLYYHIAKNYLGGVEQLREDLEREIKGHRIINEAQIRVSEYLTSYIHNNPLLFSGLHIPNAQSLGPALYGIVEALRLNFRYIDFGQEQ